MFGFILQIPGIEQVWNQLPGSIIGKGDSLITGIPEDLVGVNPIVVPIGPDYLDSVTPHLLPAFQGDFCDVAGDSVYGTVSPSTGCAGTILSENQKVVATLLTVAPLDDHLRIGGIDGVGDLF